MQLRLACDVSSTHALWSGLLCMLQAAGGVSHNGHGSMLDVLIEDTGMRSVVALGSASQVEECLPALQAGQQDPQQN